jgi:quinoprotein glucose dehydrogenase
MTHYSCFRIGIALLAMVGASAITAPAADEEANGEWRHYGNDLGGTRYSPVAQLTAQNVSGLERVWTYHVENGAKLKTLEVTPLMVGDSLYLCSPTNVLISLDPETGKERWRFDPDNTYPLSRRCRAVAYYRVPEASGVCAERILTATTDARLLAVDARTGKPCAIFGVNGSVDLTKGMGDMMPGFYHVTSAPTIVRNKVVIGGWITDNQFVGEPSGVVRAFDAVTGTFAWAWDLGRPGEHGEPEEGETYTRGTPNSWAPMSADEELGLVFLPMGNATPDFWGAHRSAESEKFSSSVVALDAITGRLRWLFQTVHHDVWDYDVASQPTLVDLEIDGRTVPALIQGTKQGQVYVLDRRTGEPITKVQERAVPQGPAPGDWLSPTQPFSVGMPDFVGGDITEENMWGLTPFDQLWCRIKFRKARYEGTYTPPATSPVIFHPGYLGGMDWGSLSVDPERKLLIVPWSRLPNYMWLIPREEADRMGVKPGDIFKKKPGTPSAQAGTPFALHIAPFLSPLAVPCTAPPYGNLTAVDLKTQKVVWSRPLGSAADSGPFGIRSRLPIPLGSPTLGGAIITGGGLIFIGATQERAFRAIDLATGKELWKDRLPVAAHATPMTYRSPASGRQFVVVAAGGHGTLRSEGGDYLFGYALPRPR